MKKLKLISQLEKLASSNLDLTFEGTEILVAEDDGAIHIATCNPGSSATKKILWNFHSPKEPVSGLAPRVSYIGLKEDGNVQLLLSDGSHSPIYPYYILHSNAIDLIDEGHYVSYVPTKDYKARINVIRLDSKD